MSRAGIQNSVKDLKVGDEVEAVITDCKGSTATVRGTLYESVKMLVLFNAVVRFADGDASDHLVEPVVLIKKHTPLEPPIGSVRMMNGEPILHTGEGWVTTFSGLGGNGYTWTELLALKPQITEYTA